MNELISHVGRRLEARELPQLMDFAFLVLHGPGGEDGTIQGLLEWLGIPYSGSGILPSAFGIDKIAQKRLMQATGLATPAFRVLQADWAFEASDPRYLRSLVQELGLPLVLKAPRQGSSIGVSVVRAEDPTEFAAAVERALFRRTLPRTEWEALDEAGRLAWVRQLVDIREGIGLPIAADVGRVGMGVYLSTADAAPPIFDHPEALLDFLNASFKEEAAPAAEETSRFGQVFEVRLTSTSGETQVLVEQFVAGREFSCIVVENERGEPLALPPTEIVKGSEVFDYRSKYLPGLARKITPIALPEADIERIREQCQAMFRTFGFEVYARLDGFIQADGTIFLNDPNTTSGMLPAPPRRCTWASKRNSRARRRFWSKR